MRNLGTDFRHALRRLVTTPLFTLFAVATLALGIGATTAIYSAVEALLRPPNILDIDRVVNIYHQEPPGSGPMILLSWPDYQDLAVQQTSFNQLAPWRLFRLPVVESGRAEVVRGETVGGNYFPLVGVQPELGRVLQPSDDQPGAPPVVVISHAFWQRWFGGDPSVVGRTLRVADEVFEVVGVVEREFRGVDIPNVLPTPLWMPLAIGMRLDPSMRELALDRERRRLFVMARLKPGVSLDQARADVTTIAGRLDLTSPIGLNTTRRAPRPYVTSRPWHVMPAADVRLDESTDAFAVPLATALAVAVTLVLLVACTNLANLMLARISRRRQEVAVRLAMGASRWRVIREQLAEGSLVAVAGGLCGVFVARVLMAMLDGPVRVSSGLVIQLAPAFNASVIGASVGATALTLIVFSLLPAIRSTRPDIRAALNADGSTTSSRWQGRRSLIAGQVMVSTILITLALLCVQQIQYVASQDLGVDLDRLAAVHLDFEMSGYDEPRTRAFLERALRDARGRVGVQQVALASAIPLSTSIQNVNLDAEGRSYAEWNQAARLVSGSPEIFDVLGMEVVRGRSFDGRDGSGAPPVAVISEVAARGLYGTVDVVGRQLQARRQQLPGQPEPSIDNLTIIGVVAEPDTEVLARPAGYLFRPWAQDYNAGVTLVGRTQGDPLTLVDPLRRTVTAIDPEIVVVDSGTGIVLAGASNLMPKIMGSIAGLLGALTLILSLSGLYGVLSHLVAGRTREVGVRMALGADRGRVARMVMRQGLRPVVFGLIAGLAIGAGSRMLMRPLIAGFFPALDPVVLALVPAPFILAATLACYLPARRAARVDPMVALRYE